MSAALVLVVPGPPLPPGEKREYKERLRLCAVKAVNEARWPKRDPDDRFAVHLVVYGELRRYSELLDVEEAVLGALVGPVFIDEWQVASHSSARVLGDPNPRLEVRVRLVVERVWPEAYREQESGHFSPGGGAR